MVSAQESVPVTARAAPGERRSPRGWGRAAARCATGVPAPARRSGLVLLLLAFTQFIVALDYNIVYVALPDIGSELGFSTGSLQWVVSAYAVAFGGFLLFGGRVVDRLGARRVLVAGLGVFGLACLVGGFAGSPGVLIAARAAQGLGAALLTPGTLALVNTRFAEGPDRTRALGVWGAFGCAGLAAGALLGGVLTDTLGWEWVLFVMVPLALLVALATPAVVPADEPRAASDGGFDLPGALLATAGSLLLVFGLVSGPEEGWGSVRGAGALSAGLLLLGIFWSAERRTRDPLMPPRLLAHRSLVVAMLVILVFQTSLGGGYYVFTTYAQGVLGYDAMRAGLAFIPLTLLSIVGSLKLATVLMTRWGPRVTLFLGMSVNGAGMLLLAAAMSTGASFWALLPGLLVWGIGGGTTFPAMFVSAASGVRPSEAGVASALATTAQQIGGAAGLAGLVAVATAGLGPGPSPAAVADGLRMAMGIGGAATGLGGFLAFALRRPTASGRSEETQVGP